MLMDLLEDLFGDLIIGGIRRVYDQLNDYSIIHPRRARAGKVLVFLLVVLVGTGWFALKAWLAWKAEDITWMQRNLILGLVYLTTVSLLGLLRFLRWRRTRQERMYDPGYQK